jgi:DNA-binding CsgD family transcriptional regulator
MSHDELPDDFDPVDEVSDALDEIDADDEAPPEEEMSAPPLPDPSVPGNVSLPSVEKLSMGDRMLHGELKPRHRRLAELAAQGKTNNEIAEILKYTASRVSILLTNSRIREEVERIEERIYEESIGSRLKKLAEPAMNEIERCLTDRSNRYKEQLKQDTAKWVVEKLDGKSTQKYDIGENMLGVLMDKLDAQKAAGVTPTGARAPIIDITPHPQLEAGDQTKVEQPRSLSEEEILAQWAEDFAGPVTPRDE